MSVIMFDDSTQQTTMNQSNSTILPREIDKGWYAAYNAILIIFTIVAMFSMGSTVTLRHLKTILRRPVGPVVGGVCQLILMPACCTGYALLLDLPDNIAIGMVLVGCTPGGTISNIIAFWSKADTTLSVCMTTISTTLAIGFLPLNMFIYSRFWVDNVAELPYVNMVITVLYLWVSVVVGYFAGRKWPKAIPYFSKIGSILALALVLIAGLVQGKVYPEIFDLNWETYVASFTMPIIGFVIGFGLSWIFCLALKQRLAIGFETGIQNTTLALTVVAITFPTSYEASYYSQFIILYTTFQVGLGIGCVVLIMLYNLIRYRQTPCTTVGSSRFEEAENGIEPEVVDRNAQRRTVTQDNNDDAVKVISVIAVSVDENDIQKKADVTETSSSSSSESDTSSSSISFSMSGDVKSKDDLPTAVDTETISVSVVTSDEKISDAGANTEPSIDD